MPEANQQPTQGQTAQVTKDEFHDLFNKSVGARSDETRKAIDGAVGTLAEQILKDKGLVVAEDSVKTIQAYIAAIDRKLTEQINAIIHHDDFKALEGTWRGLRHLVYNTETDEMLQIKVMNISKKDLSKTVEKFPGAAFDQSPLFKQIYEEQYGTLGGHPFGSFVGDYYFDHSPKDIETLTGMSQICAAAHAPFISAAGPALLGMETWQDLNKPRDLGKIMGQNDHLAWKSFRQSADSKYVGLTMPRFLARLPYGARTVPVEEFAFEEDAEGTDHSKYIWSNAAFAMGANITKAHKLYGWCTQIRGREAGGAVADLPCHVFPTTDGDSDVKCPTEIAIPDRREKELADNGLMPLCYVKNSTDAVFVGAQSAYKPAKYSGPGAAEAEASENLSARLPYTFAVCRFAHYLKCMIRDKVGKMMEKDDIERYLKNWIMDYVIENPADANEELKAKKPLAGAQIEVKEIEGNPGYFNAVFRLRPHFQLEGVNVSLRLVSKLKQGG